ncbi:MAG: YceI family protein [Verrucomicrobiota bacterium]
MSSPTPAALSAQLASGSPPLLLHVLPPESWESRRLPGSQCACVYEMTFLETVRGLAPDPATPLVVYGAGLPSLESASAAEKLAAAGYMQVTDFAGGLAEWEAAGLPVEGSGQLPPAPDFDGRWLVDAATSVIRWTGRNLFNHHEGTVPLSGGAFEITGGKVTQAHFTIDLRRIACTDLANPDYNGQLLRHLADRDFFETPRHPEAVFTATAANPIPDATPGLPNYQIEGTLNLRGVTQPLSFPALIALNDDGQLTAQAWLEIDRTRWGVNYGSGRLFSWLGKHVVNDYIGLHLKIHASRT